MAERYDALDQAIQALVDGATEIAIPRDLEELVAVAADLRELPRPEFKRILGGRMKGTMATPVVRDVTAYLIAEDIDGLVDFVKDVFGAEQTLRVGGPAGGIHCEILIEGTKVMMGGGVSQSTPAVLSAMHVFVPNVDAAYERALKAGATILRPPADQEYGSRDASVRDPFGNHWYIATQRGPLHHPPDLPPVMPYLNPAGAAGMVDFLRDALGGEVLEKHDEGGAIVHAKVRLGNSVVELGEAHAEFQPMSMMFVVGVDDADAAYARAIAAGARSMSAPEDRPYARAAAVYDGFGNQWHLTSERR